MQTTCKTAHRHALIHEITRCIRRMLVFNTLMPILKPQSNGLLYCNTVIGTLTVDGWAVIFGTVRSGLDNVGAPPSPILAVPNVTAPSMASVPTSYYLMCHYNFKVQDFVLYTDTVSLCRQGCMKDKHKINLVHCNAVRKARLCKSHHHTWLMNGHGIPG